MRTVLAMVVACGAALAHAEVLELEGTVKAVDASTRSITIERKTPKGTKTLELEVTKKAGDLSSVKTGDSISFSYDPDLELVTKLGGSQASSKAEKPLCRIGFSVSADGTSSGFIEEATEATVEADEKACERKDNGGGLWTITHRFPDRQACEPYKRSLARKGSEFMFSPQRKAIELNPSADINGGWTYLSSPYRLRLPAKVVVEVEAIQEKTYVTLPLKTWPTNTEINVISDDGFRTCDVSHLFVIYSKDRKAPKVKNPFRKEGVPLAEGCRYDVKPDPSMSLMETWGTGITSYLGHTKSCDGIRVKQISITARFVPMLGVGMKQDGDRVIVEQVLPDSQAEAAGIKPGDYMVAIAGKPISQVQRAMQLLAVTELGENWDIEIERDGQKKTFAINAEVP